MFGVSNIKYLIFNILDEEPIEPDVWVWSF